MIKKINTENFIEVLDETNGLEILQAWISLPSPSSDHLAFYFHIRQTLEANGSRVAEKPWQYPEVWVPLLNIIHNSGMSTWEVTDGDDGFHACEMCVYEHLTENIGVYGDVEMGVNYIDEKAKISATEDVFGEHAEADKTCTNCGVRLI
jgi:hypothetical protein